MNTTDRNYMQLYIVAFGSMFMMGFIDNLRGPLIPGIRETFSINYTSIGNMLFIASLGFLISTFAGGALSDRLGKKKVLLFGFLCAFLGIAGISSSIGFVFFLIMMFLLNIGLGSIEMGVNSLVSGINVKKQAVLMNLLHFFYGVGATLGPRYSGQLLKLDVPWKRIYVFSLIVVGILLVFLIFIRLPETTKYGHEDRVPIKNIIRDKKAILFGVVLGFYVSSELGIGNWFTNYLTVAHDMDGVKSSSYMSLFFILFTAGRLFGGFISEKLGYIKSVLISMIVTLFLFTGGMLLGEKYSFLISFCGLFFSIIFPTMVSVVIKEFRKSTSTILGFVVTMSSGINMISNWFIGRLNDIFSVEVGFSIIVLYIIIVIILVVILNGILESKKSINYADYEKGSTEKSCSM